QLVEENGRRGRSEPEYELLQTGAFDGDRYFDVFAEYAKAVTDDILVKISVINRGPSAAPLHVLPTLWFRNTWSWGKGSRKPSLGMDGSAVLADHHRLGDMRLAADAPKEAL